MQYLIPLIIGLVVGESLPLWGDILKILLLGFVAYGLSIYFYVYAQRVLGAAKTSAYYAVAPFIGAFLSFIILHEKLTGMVLLALAVMLAGAVLVVVDTMIRNHAHIHQHTFVHTHDGSTHSHTVTHMHEHDHIITEGVHGHRHSQAELEQSLKS